MRRSRHVGKLHVLDISNRVSTAVVAVVFFITLKVSGSVLNSECRNDRTPEPPLYLER